MKRKFVRQLVYLAVMLVSFLFLLGIGADRGWARFVAANGGETPVPCTSSNPKCKSPEEVDEAKSTGTATGTGTATEQTKQSSSCIIQMLLGRRSVL